MRLEGNIYYKQGNYKRALNKYEKALKSNQNDYKLYTNKA